MTPPTAASTPSRPAARPAGPGWRCGTRPGDVLDGEPLARAAELLAHGRVLAVKGLGGYHLAADAACEEAVALLRARKHREDKPFAVMVADLAAARRLGEVDDRGRRPADQPGPADRAAAAAGRRRPSPRRRRRGTASSGSCCRIPRCTTCCSRGGEPGRDGADQRKRLRRADRLPRRGRAGPAGRDRGRVPHPRPGDPHQDRRLGGPGLPRPADAPAAVPRLRAGTCFGGAAGSRATCWPAAPS